MAKQCEESALEIKGITNSEGSGSSFSESEFFIANNKGLTGDIDPLLIQSHAL